MRSESLGRGRGGRWSGKAAAVVVATALAAWAAPAGASTGGAGAAAGHLPPPTYRANDYAGGQAMAILPPGENGLVNATELAQFEATGQRPPYSQDQLAPYENLPYAASTVTDATLSNYYNDESFGVKASDITGVEHPAPTVPVVIYRDNHDIPHIYGATDAALAFGAGYAQAQDRLFLMDVLRHYGEGNLSAFAGPSCADEQMDHDQLLLAPYTPAQAAAQVNDLPREYGALGRRAKVMIDNYVKGINAYIAMAETNPSAMPVDYAAVLEPPQKWTPGDVVYMAGLIGGIFGDGGGSEVANSALLRYLQSELGAAAGSSAFTQFKEQNDPDAPTTIVGHSFPYELPGKVNPATTAIPDNPSAALTGGPTDTTPNCNLYAPSSPVLSDIAGLLQMPAHMSNALLVTANHSVSGHPIAVFGPQVSYFAPEILMQEDLHGPHYQAEGASFPGTGLVELGRGEDFAWSATSAGSDLTDQRLELVCSPTGGRPRPQGHYYDYDGKCLPMTEEHFDETAIPKPAGTGSPIVINHKIFLTIHGIVQGWTTADGAQPVAVVNQRSTFNHDIDSAVGFLHWADPSLTFSASSWMKGAEEIEYTFNWFYVDNRDIAYYVSGLDPVRPSDVDPNLPTWGTGNAEWTGFLPAADHPHQINPPDGYLDSWNNKPAPEFSASDSEYGYGPVYRVQMLTAQIERQFAAHGGKITRADLVAAMATAATQDLDGLTVLPEVLTMVANRPEPAGVEEMIAQLRSWYASGAHRIGASPAAAQYLQAAAVAIMDQLEPDLIHHMFDPVFGTGNAQSYPQVPMGFVNEPYNNGAHLGSAYDGGWEGYVVKGLRQALDQAVGEPFSGPVATRICGTGFAACASAVDAALAQAYQQLVQANGNANVATWTQDSETVAAGLTMPQYDSIAFRTVGIVGQPNIAWQNRPTFQQVVSFPSHRPR